MQSIAKNSLQLKIINVFLILFSFYNIKFIFVLLVYENKSNKDCIKHNIVQNVMTNQKWIAKQSHFNASIVTIRSVFKIVFKIKRLYVNYAIKNKILNVLNKHLIYN